MLEKSFGMTFFLKKRNREDRGGVRTLYLRVTVNGVAKDISTKYAWCLSNWDSYFKRATGNDEASRSINSYIDTLVVKVHQARKSLLDRDSEVSAEAIKNIVIGRQSESKTILKIFKQHNDRVAALVGTDYAAGTLSRFVTTLDHTSAFIGWKYQLADLEVSKLNFEFILDFEFWLKMIRKCSHNTTMKYISHLKKVVLLCIKKGWLPRDPFHGFKMNKREVHREVLSRAELHKLQDIDIDSESLSKSKDLFLFCCYTGLSYVDVYRLRQCDLEEGFDGRVWIKIKRQKTNGLCRIPLMPMALEIIHKYNDLTTIEDRVHLLPIASNQKINRDLKEIASLSGITKKMTFHMARHTFATTVTLTNGVPLDTVSKMLGHKNIQTTLQYAKIVDSKISEDMAKLESILQSQARG